MLKSKKTQATLVLCIMIVGFIITYNTNSFWGNLLNHGFLAAVIGGLADWFAVTALFRKPLGFISYRTEVLPRNRERIMNEIVNFIGQDLLNPKYIIKNIKNYNMAEMVINYADNMGGRTRLKFAVDELVNQIISSLDTQKVGKSISLALKGRRKNFNISRILIQYLIAFLQTPSGEKFIDYSINLIKESILNLLKQDFIKTLISNNVDIIKKRYTKDRQMRELMFDIVDLSGETLTNKLINQINKYCEKLLDYDSQERIYLKEFLTNKIKMLSKRDGYKLKVEQFEHYFFVKKYDFSQNLILLIDNFCHDQSNKNELINEVNKFLDEILDDLAIKKDKQVQLNHYIENKLIDFLQNNFQWVLDYLKAELMKYSNEEFVALVENKVSDDLQMIRINGSIIGAVAGIGLYLISFIVERMCNI